MVPSVEVMYTEMEMSQEAEQHGGRDLHRAESARDDDSGLEERLKVLEEDNGRMQDELIHLNERMEAMKKELTKVSKYVRGEKDKKHKGKGEGRLRKRGGGVKKAGERKK